MTLSIRPKSCRKLGQQWAAKLRRRPALEIMENRLAPAVIVGQVFFDANGNGVRESNEPGQGGVTVFIDLNNDGKFTPGQPGTIGEPFVISNKEGGYALQIGPGTYSIGEVPPFGFVQSTKAPDPVTVSANSATVAGPVFGNKLAQPPILVGGVITGRVFVDADGNGMQGANEVGQPGVIVFVDLNNNGKFDPPAIGVIGDPATQSGPNGNYEIKVLANGEYQVLEVVPQGFTMTTPVPGKVAVANGAVVPGPTFGNKLLPPPPPQGGIVTGRVFVDTNGNGMLDPNEAGQAGVIVFVDLNNNGKFDPPNQGTVGDLARLSDQGGNYEFKLAMDGEYQILEVVPAGNTMTSPTPGKIPVGGGATVTGPSFGNQLLPPPPVQGGVIRGAVFVDLNGNGLHENNEPGQPGVIVFIDLNGDGKLTPPSSPTSPGEPATKTNQEGKYELKVNADGDFSVLEVVPAGFKQTTPPPAKVGVAGGAVVPGPIFGNQPNVVITFGAASGRVFFDANNNGKLDNDEPGMPGIRVYSDANNNSQYDAGERTTFSGFQGRYFLTLPTGDHTLRQVVPTGFVQTVSPGMVTIVGGQIQSNQHFGNFKSGVAPIAPLVGESTSATPEWTIGQIDPNLPVLNGAFVGMP